MYIRRTAMGRRPGAKNGTVYGMKLPDFVKWASERTYLEGAREVDAEPSIYESVCCMYGIRCRHSNENMKGATARTLDRVALAREAAENGFTIGETAELLNLSYSSFYSTFITSGLVEGSAFVKERRGRKPKAKPLYMCEMRLPMEEALRTDYDPSLLLY